MSGLYKDAPSNVELLGTFGPIARIYIRTMFPNLLSPSPLYQTMFRHPPTGSNPAPPVNTSFYVENLLGHSRSNASPIARPVPCTASVSVVRLPMIMTSTGTCTVPVSSSMHQDSMTCASSPGHRFSSSHCTQCPLCPDGGGHDPHSMDPSSGNGGSEPPLHKPYLKFGVHAILSADVRNSQNNSTSNPCKLLKLLSSIIYIDIYIAQLSYRELI